MPTRICPHPETVMFDNLRAAFREAVDNFKDEVSRDEVPETVDRLLKGMIDEVTDAKTLLRDLEQGIERALAEAAREKREEEKCQRREGMARQIGDEETAKVAVEFAEKHRTRREVLEGKAVALKKELELRKDEIEEMLDKIREARKQRDALAATSGRSGARESIRGAGDLFDELDRMAEQMGDSDTRDRALGDQSRDFGSDPGLHIDPDAPSYRTIDVDQRLEELKRRMDEE